MSCATENLHLLQIILVFVIFVMNQERNFVRFLYNTALCNVTRSFSFWYSDNEQNMLHEFYVHTVHNE